MHPRRLDDDEQRVWWAFLELMRGMQAGMERQLSEAGSSGADYQVLVTLAESPRHELRPRDLGRQLGWDRSRVSHQLRRMEQRKLLTREGWESDRRGRLVRITPRGREALRAAAPGHVAWIRQHFLELLTEEDAATVTLLSTRVVENLKAER